MPVAYNEEELIPAPLVSISKQNIYNDIGVFLYPQYTFVLTGTILGIPIDPMTGYPEVGESFLMENITTEQARIRDIFADDNKDLVITTPEDPDIPADSVLTANCKVESISFQEGVWVQTCQYTIVLTATAINGEDSANSTVKDTSETFEIVEQPNNIFAITHALSAVGISVSGAANPEFLARDWCIARSFNINSTGTIAPNNDTYDYPFHDNRLIANIGATTGFWNYAISEGVGVENGSWNLTETMIYVVGGANATENYSITHSEEATRDKIVYSIQGSVQGHASGAFRNDLRFANASGHFYNTVQPGLYARVTGSVVGGLGSYVVNTVPVQRQLTLDVENGVFGYAYTYNASLVSLITGAVEEDIVITDNAPTDIFAQIPVPGKANGPVFQYMSTDTAPSRTVNISAQLNRNTGAINNGAALLAAYLAKPDTDAIITALVPSAGQYYITENTENWNPIKQNYSRTTSWTINTGGASIDGMPGTIHNT